MHIGITIALIYCGHRYDYFVTEKGKEIQGIHRYNTTRFLETAILDIRRPFRKREKITQTLKYLCVAPEKLLRGVEVLKSITYLEILPPGMSLDND